MKNFWKKFAQSLSDHRFYKDLASGAVPFTFRYAYSLALLSATAIVAVGTLGFYREGLPALRQLVSETVPADLVAGVTAGEFSINRPMPFVVPMPADEAEAEADAPANLLVVDLDAPSTLDATERYQTAAFINRSMLIVEKETGKIEAMPLKDFPDFTFTRENALGWLAVAVRYAWLVAIGILAVVSLFSFVGILFGSLVAGAIVWVVLKIARRAPTFRRSFALAAHAYSFPVALNIVLTLLALPLLGGLPGVLAVAVIASALTLIGRPTSGN